MFGAADHATITAFFDDSATWRLHIPVCGRRRSRAPCDCASPRPNHSGGASTRAGRAHRAGATRRGRPGSRAPATGAAKSRGEGQLLSESGAEVIAPGWLMFFFFVAFFI